MCETITSITAGTRTMQVGDVLYTYEQYMDILSMTL